MAMEMWSPVGHVVDWNMLFNARASLPAEAKAKLKRTRKMLRTKFVFACDEIYQHRYAVLDPGATGTVAKAKVRSPRLCLLFSLTRCSIKS